ncbi:phage tail domain-containing protein [Cohnella terricola]|uniref:Phage tail-like C-terminal domain-containing protein n=1 Tax=Cohnella terricola TaxID=1289167 RepID=A0A559JDL6_9BACL|nr:phage tail domain-containing protein [Cohnella terricola]TVX97971.1 hypothetical protein FPZ45_17145 [Cohnella terricola]
MNWLQLSGLGGYYESEGIPFALDGDGAISKISWACLEPEGTSITVWTSASFNDGHDWTNWAQCVNDGYIPDILPESDLGSAILKFRVFMHSNDAAIKPIFQSISFELEPVIVFENKGDTACLPEIWITKSGNGDFSLTNISKNNERFGFANLLNDETVYVNSEREYIETSVSAKYRYADFNDHYFDLPIGKNVLRVEGNAKLQFRYQYKFI